MYNKNNVKDPTMKRIYIKPYKIAFLSEYTQWGVLEYFQAQSWISKIEK